MSLLEQKLKDSDQKHIFHENKLSSMEQSHKEQEDRVFTHEDRLNSMESKLQATLKELKAGIQSIN